MMAHLRHPLTMAATRWRYGVGLALLAITIGIPRPTLAQDGGGTESVFRLGPTARGVSLGSAMVGMANDASAPYWNPALMTQAREAQFVFSYNSLYSQADGAAYQYLGMVYPTLRAGGFGVGLLRLSMGDLRAFDSGGRPLGSVEYAETQMLFSYAYGGQLPYLGGRMDVGLTAKIHSLELGERSTSGGMDLALAYAPRFLSGVRVSYVYQNLIAPSFRLVEMEDSAPTAHRLAANKMLRIGAGGVLELGLAYDSPQFADARVGLGAEYRLQGLYTLRAGVDAGSVNLGLGGRWRAYSLDFAYRSGGELGASQFLSFSWLFGESLESQRHALAQQHEKELEQARLEGIEAWRQSEAEGALAQLRSDLAQGDLNGAEKQMARARALGASPEELDDLQFALNELLEEENHAAVVEELREIQVREAEDRLRAALESDDPAEARAALEALQRLAGDHPILPRFEQQMDQLQAGAVARAASEATSAEADGDWVAALQAWERVAELDPGNPGPSDAQSRWRAELEAARSDSEAARLEAEKARRQLVEEQRYTVALEHFAEGEFDAAEGLAQQVLEAQPQHAGALELLVLLEEQRAAPRALNPQEEKEVRGYYLAGLSYFSAADYKSAIQEWERILEVDPGNEGALNNIAEARARLAHLQAAEVSGSGGERSDR